MRALAFLQYRERIIFLGQAVDEELGNQLVGTILYLDSENNKDMRLYINTFGGDVSRLPIPSLIFQGSFKHLCEITVFGGGRDMANAFLMIKGYVSKNRGCIKLVTGCICPLNLSL